jgi:DNA-binding IclR family transcriptional regulator
MFASAKPALWPQTGQIPKRIHMKLIAATHCIHRTSFTLFSHCDINADIASHQFPMKNPETSSEAEKTSIQVIERMIGLLDVLADYPDPVSLKELSSATGLHPSTAHRILNDLVLKRFVDRAEPGTYRLGMRLLELGNIVKSRLNVREASLDFMRALHRKTHQTVNLSVRQGDEIVYIDRSYSERSGMQVVRAIGGRAPLHLTSTGKLFLSADDPKLVRAYAIRTGLAGHNKNSITDLVKLERELSLVRARGYARDNEELELGVRCMAAGIRDDSGKLIAGLSISAPADRLQEDWIADLINTANEISAVLGYIPPPQEGAAAAR